MLAHIRGERGRRLAFSSVNSCAASGGKPVGSCPAGNHNHSLTWRGAVSGTPRGKDCARERQKNYFSLSEMFSRSSNVPRRNSSPASSVIIAVLKSVNAAFGYCSHTAKSSTVIVSHPNLNMYRPGSVTRPICAHVILLTGDLRGGANCTVLSVSSGSSSLNSPSP
jgi:hypothetical protein